MIVVVVDCSAAASGLQLIMREKSILLSSKTIYYLSLYLCHGMGCIYLTFFQKSLSACSFKVAKIARIPNIPTAIAIAN